MSPEMQLILEHVKKDAQRVGASVFYVREKTPSMLGSGYAGNHIVVFPQEAYEVGDDVLYRAGKEVNTLHRITHVKPGYVFTKGTFNTHGDGWIPVKDVIGKVKQVVRTKGK